MTYISEHGTTVWAYRQTSTPARFDMSHPCLDQGGEEPSSRRLMVFLVCKLHFLSNDTLEARAGEGELTQPRVLAGGQLERRLSARLANPNRQRSWQIKFRGGQGGPEPELLVRRPPPTLDIDIAIGSTPRGWHSIIRS
jgi:hypothetical protein